MNNVLQESSQDSLNRRAALHGPLDIAWEKTQDVKRRRKEDTGGKRDLYASFEKVQQGLDCNLLRRSLGLKTESWLKPFAYRQDVGRFTTSTTETTIAAGSGGAGYCVEACNERNVVAVGTSKGFIDLMHTDTSRSAFGQFRESFEIHNNAIFDIAFSKTDKLLATASGDQTSAVVDIETRQVVARTPRKIHQASIKQVVFDHSQGENVLATSSRCGTITLWDLRCTASKIDNDSYQRPVAIFDCSCNMDNPSKGKQRPGSKHKPCAVTAIAFINGRERQLATGCTTNNTVKLWDLRQVKGSAGAKPTIPVDVSPYGCGNERKYGVNSLCVSSDGCLIYSFTKDFRFTAYCTSSLSSGPLGSFISRPDHVSSFYVRAALSKNDQLLASGSSDTITCVLPTSSIHHRIQYNTDPVRRFDLSFVDFAEYEICDITWTRENDLITLSNLNHCRIWRPMQQRRDIIGQS